MKFEISNLLPILLREIAGVLPLLLLSFAIYLKNGLPRVFYNITSQPNVDLGLIYLMVIGVYGLARCMFCVVSWVVARLGQIPQARSSLAKIMLVSLAVCSVFSAITVVPADLRPTIFQPFTRWIAENFELRGKADAGYILRIVSLLMAMQLSFYLPYIFGSLILRGVQLRLRPKESDEVKAEVTEDIGGHRNGEGVDVNNGDDESEEVGDNESDS